VRTFPFAERTDRPTDEEETRTDRPTDEEETTDINKDPLPSRVSRNGKRVTYDSMKS
jgi:hypothetical protein